ncbi:MAG: hypothetical protein K2W85_00720 [Phycisphaerales bacterium]|nr:hypothetical protein [Phycisphaerales bacterium]
MSLRQNQLGSSPSMRAGSSVRRTARPLKIDLTPPGNGDPLAPVAPWGVVPGWSGRGGSGEGAEFGGGSTPPLADVVDRASAQLVILRKAVEEAGAADRAIRQHAVELAQRVQQGQRFASELDQRLAAAGMAAGVLEKAAGALGALERVLEQMRTAQAVVSKAMEQRLERQQQQFDRALEEQRVRFEQRLSAMDAVIEKMIGETQARSAAAVSEAEGVTRALVSSVESLAGEAERVIEQRQRTIHQQVDQVVAAADRQAAQVQARVSLVLDGASERLDLIEQQGRRLGIDAQEAIDALCERAAAVLGHDPRSDFGSAPKPGSLAERVEKAEEMIRHVDDAGVRVAACRGEAMSVMDRLIEAVQQARTIAELGEPKIAELSERIDRAEIEGQRARDALIEAAAAQQRGAEAAQQASELLARQREDLAAVAEASRYHVEQARAAERELRGVIDEAAGRGPELERSAREVRREAERLVQLARDASDVARRAGLSEQAE